MNKIMERMNMYLWNTGTSTVNGGQVELYIHGQEVKFDLITEEIAGKIFPCDRVIGYLTQLADLYQEKIGL